MHLFITKLVTSLCVGSQCSKVPSRENHSGNERRKVNRHLGGTTMTAEHYPSTETLRAAITVHLLTQWIAIFPNSICESVLYVTFFMISDWTTYLYKMSLYFFSFSLFTATNLDLIFFFYCPLMLMDVKSRLFYWNKIARFFPVPSGRFFLLK